MSIFLEHKLITSLLLVLISYPIKRYLSIWFKSRARKKKTDYRYLVNSIKNLTNLLLVIALFTLWNNELQKFALSIAAFVVAIVLATREYIQCFIGFLYVTSTSPFRVGDWVQTGSFCGEVTATDWAKLTMLEIDQDDYTYTGKTLYIPNNQLITQPIKNLNYLKRYTSHYFVITMNNNYNPYQNMETLLIKAKEYCQDFQSVAERYNAMIERSLDVSLSGTEPHISISTSDIGRIRTCFTLFCPTEKAKEIEAKLTADFFKLNSETNKVATEEEDENA